MKKIKEKNKTNGSFTEQTQKYKTRMNVDNVRCKTSILTQYGVDLLMNRRDFSLHHSSMIQDGRNNMQNKRNRNNASSNGTARKE